MEIYKKEEVIKFLNGRINHTDFLIELSGQDYLMDGARGIKKKLMRLRDEISLLPEDMNFIFLDKENLWGYTMPDDWREKNY